MLKKIFMSDLLCHDLFHAPVDYYPNWNWHIFHLYFHTRTRLCHWIIKDSPRKSDIDVEVCGLNHNDFQRRLKVSHDSYIFTTERSSLAWNNAQLCKLPHECVSGGGILKRATCSHPEFKSAWLTENQSGPQRQMFASECGWLTVLK